MRALGRRTDELISYINSPDNLVKKKDPGPLESGGVGSFFI